MRPVSDHGLFGPDGYDGGWWSRFFKVLMRVVKIIQYQGISNSLDNSKTFGALI